MCAKFSKYGIIWDESWSTKRDEHHTDNPQTSVSSIKDRNPSVLSIEDLDSWSGYTETLLSRNTKTEQVADTSVTDTTKKNDPPKFLSKYCKRLHTSDSIRLFNGDVALKKNVVGFCTSDVHRGYISRSMLVSHGCLEKKCRNLVRVNQEYWSARKSSKDGELRARAYSKERAKQNALTEERIKEVLESCGRIHVTVVHIYNDSIDVSYIYDGRVDIDESIRQLEEELSKTLCVRARVGNPRVLAYLRETKWKDLP